MKRSDLQRNHRVLHPRYSRWEARACPDGGSGTRAGRRGNQNKDLTWRWLRHDRGGTALLFLTQSLGTPSIRGSIPYPVHRHATEQQREKVAVTALHLVSVAFQSGGAIAEKFTGKGPDISPALAWTSPPARTESFALIMEDLDAPRDTFVHWMLYDLAPGAAGLPEGVAKVPQLPDGTRQGLNDFGKIGYEGPCPPPGAAHRYIFKLYALDSKPNLNPGASKREFSTAIKDHILALAELVGTFQAGRVQPRPGTTAADSGSGHAPAAEGEKSSSDPLPPRLAARIRALEQDEQYVLETDRLQRELEAAYSASPDAVTRFLRRFSLTSAFAMREVREFLGNIENEKIRRTLEDYVKYANRFRVRLRLKTDPVRFKPVVSPPYGEKFHVRIVGGHLEPATPSRYFDDPFVESFRSDDLEVLEAFQKLIDAGQATFIRIDDGPGYSILKDLESFAYKDDGVAFLLHNAEQPYLACIFGERMTKQLLANMGKAISEFQQKHFYRAHGGRPPNMERLKQKLQVERKPTSGKEKAAELAEGGDERKIKTMEVELSKLRSKRRKKNP